MTQGKRYLLLGLAVIAFGAARLPFESELRGDLESAQLMPPKLNVSTEDKVGQTFYAVAMGGLRTLVATIWNLRTFDYFTEQNWAAVEDGYDMIVDLAPRTRYYWETGSWHQAYNASAYYLYGESDLPALRRKFYWRESILKGRDFLKRGLLSNPDDPYLYEGLGRLLSDPNKIAAFGAYEDAYEQAYNAYLAAIETGNARAFARRAALYMLARIPGREAEALAMLEEMKKKQDGLFPTQQGLLYTLRYHEDPEQDVSKLIDSVFPSSRVAYDVLGNQWVRTRDHFPVDGIAKAIKILELEFGVPDERSVLKKELPSPMNPDDEFR